MESLRYYDLENILEHCASGRIDMHEPIEVSNQSHTMRSEMTVLKHLVILSKSDKLSLIHILSKLRCLIKERLSKLITDNAFVNHYIDNTLKEWRLNINPVEILNDGLSKCDYIQGDLFDYDKFLKELDYSQKKGVSLESFESDLKERQEKHIPLTPEYAKEMKHKLVELHGQCNSCADRVKSYSVEAFTKYKAMDPHHLQVLIDLTFKPKSSYLEFSNQFRNENETFAAFLSEANDLDIPDNIHTIFLNYLITLNMIKKEMNYISNSLKQILVFMNPKIDILEKLVKGFTGLDTTEVVDTVHEPPLDGEGLSESMVITDEPSVVDALKDKLNDFSFF